VRSFPEFLTSSSSLLLLSFAHRLLDDATAADTSNTTGASDGEEAAGAAERDKKRVYNSRLNVTAVYEFSLKGPSWKRVNITVDHPLVKVCHASQWACTYPIPALPR